MVYASRVILGLNGFYRGHFQNTRNIKTFFGYAIPSRIPCVREKFRVIVFAYRAKDDNSDLGIHLIRDSELPENTKLLL